jgi:hypothetical protein
VLTSLKKSFEMKKRQEKKRKEKKEGKKMFQSHLEGTH